MSNEPQPNLEKVLSDFSTRELGKIKVFIVEDDHFISELVVTKLIQNGCIPYSTTDGAEAIALAKYYMPDAIILDLMLPGRTGEEILTEIKQTEDLKHIPVIVFTNKTEETEKKRMMSLGASSFMVKAMTNLNDLVKELQNLTKSPK